MRSSTPVLVRLLALGVVAGSAAACSEPQPGKGSRPEGQPSARDAGSLATGPVAPTSPIDAGTLAAIDAGTYDGPFIAGLFPASPIMSDMEWPKRPDELAPGEKPRVIRIGYLRQGQKVPVIPEAHRKANCTDGWYELVQGGFICGRYGTLDMNHPKVRLAPRAPDLTGALPYVYGYNLTNGTPLYKHIPSRDERMRFEPWLTRKPRLRPQDEIDLTTASTATNDLDAGAGPMVAAAVIATGPAVATTADPLGVGVGVDPEDAGVPWYLRDYDGGKPQVTLDDLREDPSGPIEKRMVRGFYLSLDRDSSHFGARWWRTQSSFFTPYDRIYVPPKPITEYHGIWLNQDPPPGSPGPEVTAAAGLPPLPHRIDKLPVAFVLNGRAREYVLSDDRKTMTPGEHAAHFQIVGLTGQTIVVNRHLFHETDEGWWMRDIDGTITKPGPPPPDLAPGEKWIDVNIKTQTLVAFEGDKPVYATLISSGKRDLKDKEKDHPTKNGVFRIREKHIAATMDGDVASDGPYSIEDVPWIMYFNGSIALHGAFWHAMFGHTKSHGCVNLAPWDAKALFGWTEPRLPDGWHGVAATPEHPGTRVVVHDEEPPLP